MSEQLSWNRDGERPALRGELDQEFILPLWNARAQATDGVSTIDLSDVSRVDSAGGSVAGSFCRAGTSAGAKRRKW